MVSTTSSDFPRSSLTTSCTCAASLLRGSSKIARKASTARERRPPSTNKSHLGDERTEPAQNRSYNLLKHLVPHRARRTGRVPTRWCNCGSAEISNVSTLIGDHLVPINIGGQQQRSAQRRLGPAKCALGEYGDCGRKNFIAKSDAAPKQKHSLRTFTRTS